MQFTASIFFCSMICDNKNGHQTTGTPTDTSDRPILSLLSVSWYNGGLKCITNKLKCERLSLHLLRCAFYMGQNGDGAFVKLHGEADPLSCSYLQRLLQNDGGLLPVSSLAEGAHADLFVQVDVIPEGNCSYSACRCSLDLFIQNQRSKVRKLSEVKSFWGETNTGLTHFYFFFHACEF